VASPLTTLCGLLEEKYEGKGVRAVTHDHEGTCIGVLLRGQLWLHVPIPKLSGSVGQQMARLEELFADELEKALSVEEESTCLDCGAPHPHHCSRTVEGEES
jgi:hypothetical protein